MNKNYKKMQLLKTKTKNKFKNLYNKFINCNKKQYFYKIKSVCVKIT